MGSNIIKQAQELLEKFKGGAYAFGDNVLNRVGSYAATLGNEIVVVSDLFLKPVRLGGTLDVLLQSIKKEGLTVIAVVDGGRPNAPREDVYRLAYQLSKLQWDGVVVVGGGSCIDSAKAALVLATYGGVIDDYFGTGMVSEKSSGESLPLVAVQTASSSAAHLTKYSNITDMITKQKKLIVDDTIVPRAAVFDYNVTKTMPPSLTKDGGLDGIAHCWEVWMGATGKPYYELISEVAYLGIKLIVENLPTAVRDGTDPEARYSLGLGTDLGGYSIMIGGTNAGHLGSFSLIDLLSHGRACAILNPYYTVLFSSAIQDQLKRVANIFSKAGFIDEDVHELKGRTLGEVVARGMIALSREIQFPTTLQEAGASRTHLEKMLVAAKDPQLKMKLQNMPLPMNVAKGDIDRLMAPTLKAAYVGDLSLIPTL